MLRKTASLRVGEWLFACLLVMLLCSMVTGGAAFARTGHDGTGSLAPLVTLAELPPQGRHTYQLIFQGGPFDYEKDGSVFGNRERLLPKHPRGYYREYTVKTPRSRDRGARRIVCGGVQVRAPDVCYYTDDHYASFRRIVRSPE